MLILRAERQGTDNSMNKSMSIHESEMGPRAEPKFDNAKIVYAVEDREIRPFTNKQALQDLKLGMHKKIQSIPAERRSPAQRRLDY